MQITRRQQLAMLGALPIMLTGARRDVTQLVTVEHGQFRRSGRRYPVAGTNMWYAGYVGADAPVGDRARLGRELDRLQRLGINNVRLLGASERSPMKGAVSPTIRGPETHYDETLLRGLDQALAALAVRGMTAVIYLNNFWEWSGGMAAYLTYVNGGTFVDMNDPAHPWPAFPDFVADFYGNAPAVALFRDYVRALVGRTNNVTGQRYIDDPTIMAWQLANEPRPAGSDAVGARTMPHYQRWIRETAGLIKSLDPNHLVSTGAEGTIGCLEREDCVAEAASAPGIDYMTIHIWPQNFGWVDPKDLPGTFAAGAARTRDYIDRHVAIARRLGKPLVIEEFGFPRDGGSFAPGSATTWRDRYYRLILDTVAAGAAAGGPLAGANFWAWNGEGRAQHADHRFRPGDTQWLGDPSHEPQGWYGVFDSDRTTQAVIRGWATRMRRS